MKKLLYFLLLIAGFMFAQSPEKFEIKNDGKGINQFIVVNIKDKSASEIYQKSLAWIKKNYNSPDAVIITTVENDYIRFQGIASKIFNSWTSGTGSDIHYELELHVKDDKYKLQIVDLQQHKSEVIAPFRKYWSTLMPFYFAENIALYTKEGVIRKHLKYINNLPDYLNQISAEISKYITANPNENW